MLNQLHSIYFYFYRFLIGEGKKTFPEGYISINSNQYLLMTLQVANVFI